MNPCSVCSESFVGSRDIYTTRCGHVFHLGCLRTWFKKSKTCPECRTPCKSEETIRLYIEFDRDAVESCNSAKVDYLMKEFEVEQKLVGNVVKRITRLEKKEKLKSNVGKNFNWGPEILAVIFFIISALLILKAIEKWEKYFA